MQAPIQPHAESQKSRPTISDVARLSGVTKATVSKALDTTSRYGLSDEVRRRVAQAVEQLGYQPGGRGRAASAMQTKTIGLFYARSSPTPSDVYERMIWGVAKTLADRQYKFVHMPLIGDAENWKTQLEDRHITGGLVIEPVDRALESMLSKSVVRFVLMNVASNLPMAQVVPDLVAGARVMTRHLVELGHRRITLCSSSSGSSSGRSRNQELREEGFRLAMQQAGFQAGASTSRNPVRLIEDWSKNKTQPTAVITDTTATAVEVMHACWRKGISVPGELSVATLEDAYPAEKLSPPVTAVRSPAEQLGAEAANLLADQIEGEQSALPRKIFLTESLVVRESTARVVE